ncbi:helix-turn-helix domain-containing protein [Sandaracinus amylolyticus]|uniref:Transcriptional regulator, AraC family protein n=1 Tax=Sandaracinus amylolyticus TaxID=927083 RepID=A0A0F6YHP1_9BACT|nr:helix-turn-helix domain-containing protein [Sandaracinus amylolyticus]AKF05278.1 Transcriptional regulator, AraC family protein [Sandaracinus amylolyticus]
MRGAPKPYEIHTPVGPLAPLVEYFWALPDAPSSGRGSILPSGTLSLVIHLDEDERRIYDAGSDVCRRFSGAVVSGAHGRPFLAEGREHTSAVGIHFRPGGAWPFFGAALGELADRHVDLDALWGASAIELRERLCGARTVRDRFRILEAALVQRLERARPGHGAVAVALRALERGDANIGALSAQVGLSRRRLIEVFTAQVGVTPKKFARLRRFQRVLDATRRAHAPSWSRVAVASGYFDQAHLIRDFVEFCGLSPSEFARVRDLDATNHHVRLPEWESPRSARSSV